MKTKTFITAALAFASAFVFSARFPASIQKLDKDYTKRNISSLLTRHYTAVDIVRNDLIDKHLSYFKKTNQPSNADFNALEEDLKHFLKVDAIVETTGIKEAAKVKVHPIVMNVLSDSEKKQAVWFAEDFNSNILPYLYRAIVTKDKKSVVSHLRKWNTNNKKYSQFVKTCLKAHQKKHS